ncbi:hypothetical protein Tco_0449284 [Tanacetum coccineum]
MPGPEYPEYLAPSDEEVPIEDQPYDVADSPIALSPGYVANSDPEVDSEECPVDYPANGGDGDDDDSSNNDEEEEEHLAPADYVVAPVVDHVPSSEETGPFKTDESTATPPSPPAYHTTARISIRPRHLCLFHQRRRSRDFLPYYHHHHYHSLSPYSAEERLARCLVAPALPLSPLPIISHPYDSPNHVLTPPGFKAAMGRLRALSPSTHHPLHPSPTLPPPPSSLHLPPHVPTSLPLPSSPLPASLYEVGESSTAAPRPTGGHGIDYGIRDVWVDPTEAVEEVAPTTLEGVNPKVTELAAVQEQDTQDIYDVIEDTQDRQTQLFQRVDGLVEDRQTHTQMQDFCIASHESLMTTLITHVSSLQGQLSAALGQIQNNMPPRRSSATARAAAAAVAAATPMTAAAVE